MALDFLRKPFQKIKDLNNAAVSSRLSITERRGEKSKANGALVNDNVPHSGGKARRNDSKKANNRESLNGHSSSKNIDQSFMEVGPGDGAALYKPLSVNMSKRRGAYERFLFKDLDIQSKCLSVSSFKEVGGLGLQLIFPNKYYSNC